MRRLLGYALMCIIQYNLSYRIVYRKPIANFALGALSPALKGENVMKRIIGLLVAVVLFGMFAGCSGSRLMTPVEFFSAADKTEYRNITVSEVQYREVPVAHGGQLPWSVWENVTLSMEWSVVDTIRGEEMKYPSIVRLLPEEELPEGNFGQGEPVYKTAIRVSLPMGTSRRAWEMSDFACDNLLREGKLAELLIGVEEDSYFFTLEVGEYLRSIDRKLTPVLEKLVGVE